MGCRLLIRGRLLSLRGTLFQRCLDRGTRYSPLLALALALATTEGCENVRGCARRGRGEELQQLWNLLIIGARRVNKVQEGD